MAKLSLKCRLPEAEMGELLAVLTAPRYDAGLLKCTDYRQEFVVDAGQLVLTIE